MISISINSNINIGNGEVLTFGKDTMGGLGLGLFSS